MPAPSVGLTAQLSRLLLLQYYSRHPTGTPFFIETCEKARAWAPEQTANGTGGYKVSTGMELRQAGQQGPPYETVYNGREMLMLTSPGRDSGYLHLNHIMAIPANLRLGFEIFFAFPYSPTTLRTRSNYFRFGFALDTVDNMNCQARVQLDPANRQVELYQTTGGTTPRILDLSGNKEYGTYDWLVWQNAKLIVDFGTMRYVKLFWNEDEIDLSDYPIYQVALVAAPRLNNIITIGDRAAPNQNQYRMFVGGIILTLEEP